MRITILSTVVVLAAVLCSAENDLVLGVRDASLGESLGVTWEIAWAAERDGRCFIVDSPNAKKLRSLHVGVYPSEDLARAVLKSRHAALPVMPLEITDGAPVGDSCVIYESNPNAPIISSGALFRRKNCIVDFRVEKPTNEMLLLAQQIDSYLQNDTTIAPRGTFAVEPAIVSLTVPASVPAKGAKIDSTRGTRARWAEPRFVKIDATFAGLGNVADLRVKIEGRDGSNEIPNDTKPDGTSWETINYVDENARPQRRPRTPDENGRFMLVIPEKPGNYKLRMVVSTPDNLIVTKDFEITVTDPPPTSQPTSTSQPGSGN